MAVRKVAVITANTGSFDKQVPYVEQSVEYDFYSFDDTNFPPRSKALTSRLQARIPKIFGWQMVPGYEAYIWVDSSCSLQHPDSVKWFLDQLTDREMAVFRHPTRSSIQEEADYLKDRLRRNDEYITSRYAGELIDEQLKEVDPTLPLYATTALAYYPTHYVKVNMKEWWYHVSRYHVIDQLSLPHVLDKGYATFNVIPNNIYKMKYLTPVRK